MRKLIAQILATILILASTGAMAQKCTEKKISPVSKIVAADSIQIIIHSGSQNILSIYGSANAVKTFSAKQKNGALSLYQTTRAQVFATEEPIKIHKNMDIDSVVITLRQLPENITGTNGAIIRFASSYNPKRLILRLDKNSQAYGNINCDAFGLYLQTGAEAYISGQYRTTRITVDSSKAVLDSYQAENSEFSVTGGSILQSSGKTHMLKLTVGGLSRIEALEMSTSNATADISGRSDAFFNVTGSLKLKGRDKSHIIVTGNPKTEADVSNDCKYGRR